MDPGMLMLLTGVSSLVASAIGIHTGVSAMHQYAAGHGRGDHSSVLTTLFQGGLATGTVATAPLWVPKMIAMANAMRVL